MLQLRRLILFCLGFLFVVGAQVDWSSAQESSVPAPPLPPGAQLVPEGMVACVSGLKDYPDRYIFLSTSAVVKGETFHYYTIGVNRLDRALAGVEDSRTPPEKAYWETTVSVDEKGECRVVLARNQFFTTLQALMPKAAARQLALQRLQKTVDQDHGTQKLQESINRTAKIAPSSQAYGDVILAPETVWVLKQLGIKVPPQIQVYPEPKEAPDTDSTAPSPTGVTP